MNEIVIGFLINLGIIALILLAIGIKRLMRGRIQK